MEAAAIECALNSNFDKSQMSWISERNRERETLLQHFIFLCGEHGGWIRRFLSLRAELVSMLAARLWGCRLVSQSAAFLKCLSSFWMDFNNTCYIYSACVHIFSETSQHLHNCNVRVLNEWKKDRAGWRRIISWSSTLLFDNTSASKQQRQLHFLILTHMWLN